MSRARVCDRCKKILECNPSAKIEIDFGYYGTQHYELCEDCKQKLLLWINRKEKTMKDKQIEEMAMCSHCKNAWNCKDREAHSRLEQLGEVIGCTGYEYEKPKTAEDMKKEFMANMGYRKASEVAREIFEEIDLILFEYNIILNGESGLLARFAELKKKYESEGEG